MQPELLVEDEAIAVLRRGARTEEDAPDLLSYGHHDSGNAERIIALYGESMLFCHALKNWLIWDGARWAVDGVDRARKLAKETMLVFFRQAVSAQSEPSEKFAKHSLDARRISSMLSLAEPEIFVRPEELDAHPYLLNFMNGTVDLRSGKLQPHDRTQRITKLIHYEYHAGALCPRWITFLDQIMGGGPDAGDAVLERSQRLTEYLQRALGYSLTGVTNEKAVFVLFGEGNNGKSTMLSTFRQLVEEYSALLQADTLMARQETNNTQADLSDLRGARFVQTSETEEGQRLSQGKFKRITQGMGKIKAARKYENPIEFSESHKLWMDTNRKPTIKDADDKAMFSRLHPIPFTVTIQEIDRDLPSKLLQEAEGILAWAVAGAVQWRKSGLGKPPEVEAANQRWHDEVDQLGRFIEERCVTGDGFSAVASNLYAEYKRWAESGGEQNIMTSAMFGRKLPERGFEKVHTMYGWKYRGIGIAIKDERGEAA